jgi:formate hydrogenlyase subunit 3/multisubunit Na+/H+ antiporter MnhD subunit
MQPLALTLGLVAALLGLAVLAVGLARASAGSRIVYGLAALLTASLAAIGIAGLLGPDGEAEIVLPLGVPWIGAHFRLDSLSAFFLAVVNAGGAAASVYAIGYGAHEHAPGRVLPFYPAFLAGMSLVLLAADAFTFLLSWELMSLASWALVMAHHEEQDNARAGYVYLVMASFGTLALLLAFGVLAGADGGYSFAAMRARDPSVLAAGFVFALALMGTGSKAGLVPLHVWLPLAHPAAPSHVSALMSGVMTKVAVYGFIRIVFDLLDPPVWWWSVPVLVLGAITAVLGLLHAVLERDLKRLLAYSTVENIGVIFIALGLALAFKASAMQTAAALAATAALLHGLNHAAFKSLLFFGAGAVLNATGRRDMEALGGLIGRMPRTAFAFLIGAAAISALPPLNGFVSEWLIFQAILVSPGLPQWGLKFLVPAVGAMLALSAALAATCFVRAFGITFLGRPRSDEAARAEEVDGFSTGAMLGLAAVCVLAGVLPGLLVDALAPAVTLISGSALMSQHAMPWLSLVPIAPERSSYNGLIFLAFIAISGSLTAVAIHRFASRRIRRAPPWDCGFPVPIPATQYSAGSFAQPIRRVFGTMVFRARETVDMPLPGELRPARHGLVVRDLVWDELYLGIVKGVGFAAEKLNRLQFLTIRRYLGLVFAALVGLLTVLALWQ